MAPRFAGQSRCMVGLGCTSSITIRDVRRFTGSRGGNVEPNTLDSREIRSFVASTNVLTLVGAASVPVAPSFKCQRVGGACCRWQRSVLVCTFVVAPLRPPAGPPSTMTPLPRDDHLCGSQPSTFTKGRKVHSRRSVPSLRSIPSAESEGELLVPVGYPEGCARCPAR